MKIAFASFAVAALFLVTGCGGKGSGFNGDGGVQHCTTSGDCSGTQVCQPYSQTCVDPAGACTSNAQCTGATYCETSVGQCLPSSTGSPCSGPANCAGSCTNGTCGCDGVAYQQQLQSKLDVYLILDRTQSMGTDCSYTAGTSPPVSSKACYATYALCDYLIGVSPTVDTRLAFQFMSQPNDCNGAPYLTPIVPLTQLPVAAGSTLVQTISNETFAGGLGTHIEGALRGIAGFTSAQRTAGREMIGVLMTDGDPNGCEQNIATLAGIIDTHRRTTGIRTFIIGMQGATEANLETLAIAGGADPHNDYCGGLTPPCHYWNVGNGSGAAITSALTAIVKQAVPLPCTLDITGLSPPPGQTLDYGKINVTFTQGGTVTTIGQTSGAGSCPASVPAWYYNNPAAPTTIELCASACQLATGAASGARLDVVVGCDQTVIIP